MTMQGSNGVGSYNDHPLKRILSKRNYGYQQEPSCMHDANTYNSTKMSSPAWNVNAFKVSSLWN